MKYDYTLAVRYFHIATVHSILSILPEAAMETLVILRKNWNLYIHEFIVHLLLAVDLGNNLQQRCEQNIHIVALYIPRCCLSMACILSHILFFFSRCCLHRSCQDGRLNQ